MLLLRPLWQALMPSLPRRVQLQIPEPARSANRRQLWRPGRASWPSKGNMLRARGRPPLPRLRPVLRRTDQRALPEQRRLDWLWVGRTIQNWPDQQTEGSSRGQEEPAGQAKGICSEPEEGHVIPAASPQVDRATGSAKDTADSLSNAVSTGSGSAAQSRAGQISKQKAALEARKSQLAKGKEEYAQSQRKATSSMPAASPQVDRATGSAKDTADSLSNAVSTGSGSAAQSRAGQISKQKAALEARKSQLARQREYAQSQRKPASSSLRPVLRWTERRAQRKIRQIH